jgi:hypothetical protein
VTPPRPAPTGSAQELVHRRHEERAIEPAIERGEVARPAGPTGEMSDVAIGDHSVDYRAASDDIVIGTFTPSLRRLSMATGKAIGPPLALADPNDVPAPYRLDDL